MQNITSHLCCLFCALFIRFTMSRNFFMGNWTSSVTQTWWTSPWMCTEAFSQKRIFPIVSIKVWGCISRTLKSKNDVVVPDRNQFLYHIIYACTSWFMLLLKTFFILLVSALREKRTEVVAQLKQLQSETEPIVKMFEDPETTRQMQSTR